MNGGRFLSWPIGSGSLWLEARRFLFAGASNTILTILIYQLLLFFLDYAFAFTISFAIGILYSVLLYSNWVFQVRMRKLNAAVYAVYYIISYCAGLGLLELLVRNAEIGERMALFIVVAILVPINFILARLILRYKASRATSP